MSTALQSIRLTLNPENNQKLTNFCGPYDTHIQQIADYFGVRIKRRSYDFQINGMAHLVKQVARFLPKLYQQTSIDEALTPAKIHVHLKEIEHHLKTHTTPDTATETSLRMKNCTIKSCNENQTQYLKRIAQQDINFAIGPAGTGKTYLAVASAVNALEKEHVQRILLVRPAIEAGEKLGFLPGDLEQKVSPYLRPLYDALYEMLGFERVNRYIEKDIIEIAPLAYMRGRTLNDSFVILDEGQNTTVEQMKMFLTRIGFGSKAIITGDITQIDLPNHIESGLEHAVNILKDISGISVTYFTAKDAVRHPLVQSIIQAYERHHKPRGEK